jgi:hypothetical protein
LNEAEKVELPENVIQYYVGISKGTEAFEVQLSSSGDLINKTAKEVKKGAPKK